MQVRTCALLIAYRFASIVSCTAPIRPPPPSRRLYFPGTGLRASTSEYQSGRLIMVYKPQQQSLWVFLQPFENGVWLLMFGATVVVALSIMVSALLCLCSMPGSHEV